MGMAFWHLGLRLGDEKVDVAPVSHSWTPAAAAPNSDWPGGHTCLLPLSRRRLPELQTPIAQLRARGCCAHDHGMMISCIHDTMINGATSGGEGSGGDGTDLVRRSSGDPSQLRRPLAAQETPRSPGDPSQPRRPLAAIQILCGCERRRGVKRARACAPLADPPLLLLCGARDAGE